MRRVLALDQGTTSSRALVIDETGSCLGIAQREFAQHYPHPGWVEHDPLEIWLSQRAVIEEVLEATSTAAADLSAIGITNQRETTLVWDRATGAPIYPAIVWQDRRTAPICEALEANGHSDQFRSATGLVLDPYFSGTKIRWILDNVPGAQTKAQLGGLAFGTVDSWLIWKLSGGTVHAIDATNASRTLLYNLRTGDWDDELLKILQVPRAMLPRIVPSSGVITEATVEPLAGVPIAGVAGDQQAALFGQACFTPGLAKNTYGTGCFLLLNTGSDIIHSSHQLLSTVAWQIGEERTYALEGSVFSGGSVVQWLRDGLGIIESAAEVEALAASVDSTDGVVLVPAFTGMGAPYWNAHCRGTIVGLTRGTTRAHLARAALEAIAFQVADLVDCMGRDAGRALEELRVDGGASANGLLLQLQANALDRDVVRPRQIESTALGVAYLAGLATGVWSSQDEIAAQWAEGLRVKPNLDADVARVQRHAWHKAVTTTIHQAEG